MLPASSVVKLTARTVLKGNWIKSIVASAVLIFAYIIALYVSQMVAFVSNSVVGTLFFAALCALLLAPLALGELRFFRRMQWGADDNAAEVFAFFSQLSAYKRVMKLVLLMLLKAVAIGIPLFIPSIIAWVISSGWLYGLLGLSIPAWSSVFEGVSAFLRGVAGITAALLLLRYYLAPFLFVADEAMEPAEAMHMSAVISKRSGLDFFFLFLSMLGWILISLFMIPVVFTVPYFIMAYLVHCRFSVTQYNKVVDSFNSFSAPTYAAE